MKDFIVAGGKTTNKWQLTNVASNVGIAGVGSSRGQNLQSRQTLWNLVHASDGFFQSCLSFSSSFAKSSLLTRSLSWRPLIFLELRCNFSLSTSFTWTMILLAFSSLTSLRYLEVLLSQLGYFQFLGSEFFTKHFFAKYSFLQVHPKLLDVILQILVIHRSKVKTSSCW
mgnify:CR=1 FL=1